MHLLFATFALQLLAMRCAMMAMAQQNTLDIVDTDAKICKSKPIYFKQYPLFVRIQGLLNNIHATGSMLNGASHQLTLSIAKLSNARLQFYRKHISEDAVARQETSSALRAFTRIQFHMDDSICQIRSGTGRILLQMDDEWVEHDLFNQQKQDAQKICMPTRFITIEFGKSLREKAKKLSESTTELEHIIGHLLENIVPDTLLEAFYRDTNVQVVIETIKSALKDISTNVGKLNVQTPDMDESIKLLLK